MISTIMGVERRISDASSRYDTWYNDVVVDLSLQVEAYAGFRLEVMRRKFGGKTAEVINLPLESPSVAVAQVSQEPQISDVSTA